MDTSNHNNVDNREEGAKEHQQHKQPVMPQNAILARGRKRKCPQTNDGHDADAEEDELLLKQPDDDNKGIEDGYADDMEFETKSSSSNSATATSVLAIGSAADISKSVSGHEECQKLLAQRDSLIQELSLANAQLREEKEEIIAENAKQIDALHIQLEEMRQPHILLPAKQMKVQLPFENWAELLGFLSRRELGEVVANVGNRHFAWLLQSFLHEYGEITLGSMELLPPDEEFARGRPFIRTKPKDIQSRLKTFLMIEPIPKNVTNFNKIELSYFDNSILNFLQQFKQKSLLANANLSIASEMPVDIVMPLLTHLLPLIEGSINSIKLCNIRWPNYRLYDYAGNLMKMLPMTRILQLSFDVYNRILSADKIEFCCRWLYIPREDDGKSRVLFLTRFSKNTAISPFIERIKKDFSSATQPFNFFILLHCVEAHEQFNFENAQTAEKLEIKTLESNRKDWKYKTLLIARHPMGLQRQWIEANVKEAMEWTFKKQRRRITMNNLATKIVM